MAKAGMPLASGDSCVGIGQCPGGFAGFRPTCVCDGTTVTCN
jgi:hypothetical protein